MRVFAPLVAWALSGVAAVRHRSSKGGKKSKGGKQSKGGKVAAKSAGASEAILFPGAIDITRPAFIYEDKDHNEFVISQFGRLAKLGETSLNPFPAASKISRMSVAEVSAALSSTAGLKSNTGSAKTWVGSGIQWPNILSKSPPELGEYTIIPDGFLPPGKSNGGLFLAKPNGKIFRCVPYKRGAFYHEVEWHDMNGDGLKDMISARVTKSLKGLTKFKFEGELLWFENPGKDKMFSQQWKPHLITKGPDVVFRTVPYGDDLAIYATEFFADTPRIVINFVSHHGGKLLDQVTVDDNLGSPFGIELVDIDGDGKKDLLATNHQNDEDDVKASIYAYEIPDDIKTGTFKRHTLTGWPAKLVDTRTGSGSPGFATAFYPRLSQTSGPKHVLCAGDGSFDIWYLKPTGTPFEYETQVLPINGTTGQLVYGDWSGDGIMDVLIPDNDNWKIYGMTFTGV